MNPFEDVTLECDALVLAIDLKTKPGADFADRLGIEEIYVRRDISVALCFSFRYLVVVKKSGMFSRDAFLAVDLPGLEEAVQVGAAIGRSHRRGRTVCVTMPHELSCALRERMQSIPTPPPPAA